MPIEGVERVPLIAALGRILAQDLVSRVAVPAHDNAAMDGFALASRPGSTHRLRIVGEAHAGRPFAGSVADDACVRIMTGAVMPSDCDAVVPHEAARIDDDCVTIDGVVARGQHRRLAGEDLQVGAVALARGRRIAPADLGLAASLGVDMLDVVRRLKVAVFSTGDELRAVDQPLDPGSVRDANRHTLIGMLTALGIDAIDLGIVRDDPAALEDTLLRACEVADAIVTSGGVSAGDADHTRDVMARVGDIAFWTLAIKPGRPMAFGHVGVDDHEALLFALPGNPVAVMVVFYALVRDALTTMAGGIAEPLPAITAITDMPFDKVRGRTEFVRGIASRAADGWHVRTTGTQSSGVLRSMSEANCLIVLEHDRGPVAPGERVEAWPFRGLV